MNRTVTIAVTTLSLSIVFPRAGSAQTAKDLVGTWLPVSAVVIRQDGSKTDTFGRDLKGILNFDNSGRFAFILTRSDLPKFASNNRNTGTAEENRSIVQGSLAYFGTYSLADKIIKMHVDGGTWPGWTGTDIERLIFSFSSDELKWTDPTPSIGGKVENVWRRAN
jgi:Lipocalin-like domain